MHTFNVSIVADSGGKSERLQVGINTSVQSARTYNYTVLISVDQTVFFRAGNNPVAVNDGSDIVLIANQAYRVQLGIGQKLSFIAASVAANVYITQE